MSVFECTNKPPAHAAHHLFTAMYRVITPHTAMYGNIAQFVRCMEFVTNNLAESVSVYPQGLTFIY